MDPWQLLNPTFPVAPIPLPCLQLLPGTCNHDLGLSHQRCTQVRQTCQQVTKYPYLGRISQPNSFQQVHLHRPWVFSISAYNHPCVLLILLMDLQACLVSLIKQMGNGSCFSKYYNNC